MPDHLQAELGGAAAAGFTFEQVIAPISRETFFAEYYETQGLTVFRDDPDYYASVLSVDRLDQYITTASPHWPQICVVDAHRDVDRAQFTLPGGGIDVTRLYQLFADGSTLVFPSLHFKIPELAALCRAVEREFNAPFQTNIYLSPPNAQGFKIHYDTHDVFVLQVAGAKDWRVYDTPVQWPLIGQKFQGAAYETVPPAQEFRLNAGDLYYCPRGIVHDARSTDQISLHITFGLMAQTWTELMVEAVASVCLEDPAFRRNLPIGYAEPGFDRTAARQTFRSLLGKLAERADFDAVLDQFAGRFVADRLPHLRGQMDQVLTLDALDADTRIQARRSLIYRLHRGDTELRLSHFKTDITLPAAVEPTLVAMLAATDHPVALADLPGPLDLPGRITLARRLIREGLIVRV